MSKDDMREMLMRHFDSLNVVLHALVGRDANTLSVDELHAVLSSIKDEIDSALEDK